MVDDESLPPEEENPEAPKEDRQDISQQSEETRGSINEALDPVLQRKEKNLKELAAKRESKEISPYDFDLNVLFNLNQVGQPLVRSDMKHETGEQALVLTRADLEDLGCLDFIHTSGERMLIEPENVDENDVFILYPSDVEDVKIVTPVPAETNPQEVSTEAIASAEEATAEEAESNETKLRNFFFEVFAKDTPRPPYEPHKEWEEIVKRSGDYVFQTVKEGRAKNVPDHLIKKYTFINLMALMEEGKYGMCLRIVQNLGFGTAEQQFEFERVLVAMDPKLAQQIEASKIQKREKEALNASLAIQEQAMAVLRTIFADVPEKDVLVAELPTFWESLTPKVIDLPAGVVIDGREAGIPETHLRRFALEIIESKIEQHQYAWIARFLKNMKFGSEDDVLFFENLP